MTTDRFLTLDGRPTVRIERRFPHTVDKVWQAVTTPEHLARWFPSTVELDLRPGGSMRFGEGGPGGAVGVVEQVDPPRRLQFTWGDDRLTFELDPDGDGTTLSLTHSFDERSGAPSFGAGWDICLGGLRQVLAGGPAPAPDWGIARHEQLVHEFGLDQPEISESEGRWTVRIERQLTCPAEVAWNLWFGVDQTTGEQRGAPGVGEPLTPYMAPDVVIGTMTEVDAPRAMAFDVAPTGGPGDHLRVEFPDGTGHGARIILTVTGSDADERDAAAEMWCIGAVGHLAASAAEWRLAQAVDAER